MTFFSTLYSNVSNYFDPALQTNQESKTNQKSQIYPENQTVEQRIQLVKQQARMTPEEFDEINSKLIEAARSRIDHAKLTRKA